MADQKQEILISQPVVVVYLFYFLFLFYLSLYVQRIAALFDRLYIMYSRSINSIRLFSILSNASRDQKFKMAAQKPQIITE